MHKRRRRMICIVLLFMQAAAAAQNHADAQSPPVSEWITEDNLASPPDLPVMGKWMIGADGAPAHWMGQTHGGKNLREPINVVIIDEVAESASQASARILAATAYAGYSVRLGHSTGYQAYLDGRMYAQLPHGWDDAFSDEPFELSNNHGRLFGPHETSRGYVLIGAFSREKLDPFRWPGHQYASFNKARDDFAKRLDQGSRYRLIGYISLGNSIIDDPVVSTGDHDAKAVLLKAAK